MDEGQGSGETEIYVAREIWEGMRDDGNHRLDRLEVLLPGYGQFGLRFEQPADEA